VTEVERGFQFGGRLSLDLTWTLRYRAIAPTELLRSPEDLRTWCSLAVAPVEAPVGPTELRAAVELREAIHGAATAVIDGVRIPATDRATINDWASRPSAFRSLDRQDRAAVRLRPGAPVESALAVVAADAVDVLGTADGRLRRCEGPGCSLLFHDSSRPGSRRWCSTARCGNRVNTVAYRRRRVVGAADPDRPDRTG